MHKVKWAHVLSMLQILLAVFQACTKAFWVLGFVVIVGCFVGFFGLFIFFFSWVTPLLFQFRTLNFSLSKFHNIGLFLVLVFFNLLSSFDAFSLVTLFFKIKDKIVRAKNTGLLYSIATSLPLGISIRFCDHQGLAISYCGGLCPATNWAPQSHSLTPPPLLWWDRKENEEKEVEIRWVEIRWV